MSKEDLYETILENPDDFSLYEMYADLLEEDGEVDLAVAYRYMGQQKKTPVRGGRDDIEPQQWWWQSSYAGAIDAKNRLGGLFDWLAGPRANHKLITYYTTHDQAILDLAYALKPYNNPPWHDPQRDTLNSWGFNVEGDFVVINGYGMENARELLIQYLRVRGDARNVDGGVPIILVKGVSANVP